jgi:endoglucanase
MDYAEAAFAVHDYDPLPVQASDARNLAAADLFKLTGDARWHEVFLATTRFNTPGAALAGWPDDQRDAAFTYLRTPNADPATQEIARAALLAEADYGVWLGAQTGFRWTKGDSGAPISWGGVSAPNIKSVLRVHAITGDEKYLRTAVLAAQVSAGANPVNLCYTTGVGHTWPRRPLWIDSHNRGGMLPPPGLTVYGPLDIVSFGQQEDFAVQLIRPHLYPAPEAWPALEFYFDVFMFPQSTEFTVMQTMGPNSYTWGYLAARREL